MFKRILLAALLVATQTAALVAGPVRGRAFDVPFQIVQISDGSDVTSGTVTVKVSKDGGAQATSTNSATHLGGGQWKVTLTPAEMDATSVGVQIAESGSYTTSQTIITEQPQPASRWVSKYDGVPKGNLLSTFARAQATVDDTNGPIAANERRFSATEQSVAGLVNYQSTGYDLGTQASILMGGRDLDGTGLLVVYDQPATDVDIIKINSDRTATLVTSTDVTAFPGAGGGISYTPRAARVIYGTVVVMMQRTNGAVIEGITLCWTQDNGVTWNRVENSAADGGGFAVPKPAAYGTNADTIPRGREWAMSLFPVGGMDSNGNFNPNDFFVTWTDYLHAGSPVPKGWQCGAFRITRQSPDQDFTIGKDRVFYERWEPSVSASNLHGHTVGLTGNGLFVLMVGDSEGQHAFHAIDIDLDTYETASPTITTDWFGQTVGGATNGKGCPQMSMSFPGWSGTVLGSNDTWPSPVLQINNATTGSEACVISSNTYVEADTFTGGFKTGWDNIWAQWDPGLRGHGARSAVGGFGAYTNIRHYSENGKNFALINNADGFEGPHAICGEYLAIVRTSDEMLMLAPIPGVKTHKPLKLAPGADNLLSSAALDDNGAPTTGNTRSRVVYTNGEFRYASGGALVPNAPKTQPPLNNPEYYLLDPGAGSAANYIYGSVHLQAAGQTVNIGSGVIGATLALAPCSANAVGRWSGRVGVSGATNDSAGEFGIKTDWTQSWQPFSFFGDPINNPAAARGLIQFYAGPAFGSINPSCPILVAIGGFYNGQLVTPWPTARLSTSNANEVASETLPTTLNNKWTVSSVIYRSTEQATIGSAPPAGTLQTIWRDANNFVAVHFDGPNFELEITVTTNGVAGTTQVIAMEDWPRTNGLPIMVSDNGTDVVVSIVSNRNGLQTATCTGNTLNGPPTSVRWSNATQSSVYNFWTAGCEFRDEALTLQQQAVALRSLDFIDTDAELLAAAAADEVELQLASAFDDTSTDVWLQKVPTTTGTTGLRLSRIPDVTAGAAGGIFIAGSNAATTVNFTGNLSGSVGSVTGAVGSVTGNVGGNVVGSVASVTGNVGGNVTGSVGLIGANGLSASSIATGAITSAKFASGAIDSAAVATDAIGAAELANSSIDAATFTAGAIDSNAIATDAIGSAELAANAIGNAEIASAALTLDRFSGVFPSNFPTLSINASGHVSRVTLADTITTYTGDTPQTGDSFARIGANGAGLTALATQASVNLLPDAADISQAVDGGQTGQDAAAIVAKLPTAGAKIAGEGATAKNLDQVEGGGAADWTDEEKQQMRYRLGLDGTTDVPSTGTPAILPLTSNGLTNFSTFYNNGGAASSKTINNVTAPKNVTIVAPN